MCTSVEKIPSIVFLLVLLTQTFHAQVTDDFSDGDFISNPTWQGDTANFNVNTALELQLDAPAAGTSALFLPAGLPDSAVWEIYFRLEFDPSSSNRLRIYLFSTTATLLTGNGYFLQIGEDGSADAIKLFRQDAGSAKLLASATSSSVATSPNVRLKIIRENGEVWKLAVDYSGGFNFLPEFETTDATYGSNINGFFGLHCIYTATRRDKFFFDDIALPAVIPDTSPPVLLSALAVSAIEVDVLFDEPLDEISATETSNYSINNGIGEPNAVFHDDDDKRLVHLSLATPLINLTDYSLTASGIGDLSSNVSSVQTTEFFYLITEAASKYDILINEIMADPTPPVTLPQVEFIELFNRSDKVIDLAGFTFSSGGTPQVFPSYKMLPGSYVIVCDDSKADSMAAYGEVVVLASFPALTNDADDLTLTDAAGQVIHYVKYTTAWYKDTQKAQGGWTLELVNPLSPCEGESNWRASANLSGGTPGKPNSVLSATPDETGPQLVKVFASPGKPDEITLYFNKSMSRNNAENSAAYQMVPNIEISMATLLAPSDDVVFLKLETPMQKSILYQVKVLNTVTDCIGNSIGEAGELPLALPELPGSQEIVINEILFNPATGGSDFVEIYNRSNKIFNLGNLLIGNILEGIDTVLVKVTGDRLIFPGDFVVFTENPSDILGRYTVKNENSLISNSLPSFNDKDGNVTILRADTPDVVIIDAFTYDENMHHPLLSDVNGVSLERLNPDRPTQNRNNWHSAAATAGYATPTYRNSQFFENEPIADDFFQIPDATFSPDGDGYKDFLAIFYKTDKPGYTATVKVFDAEGKPIKSLTDNELLATEGFLRWEGDTDEGTKARIGIYVVWIQLINPDGSKKEYKKAAVLASRL